MGVSKNCMSILITIFNLLIIILAIIICFLSLTEWNDYATCAFTIIVAVLWMCCLCFENNIAIGAYSALMIIDVLLLLSNALYHTIMTTKYTQYCYHNRGDLNPAWGCYDWRHGHYERAIGVTVSYYLAFLFRLANIVGSCTLAHKLFND